MGHGEGRGGGKMGHGEGRGGGKRDVQIMHAHGIRIMTDEATPDESGEDCMYLVTSGSKLAKAKKRRLKFLLTLTMTCQRVQRSLSWEIARSQGEAQAM
jgi:hypothetical protein